MAIVASVCNSTTGRQKQDQEFKPYLGYIVNSKVSLSYVAGSYFKNKTKNLKLK